MMYHFSPILPVWDRHICAGVIAAGEVPLDFQRYRVGNIGTLIAQHFLHVGIPLGYAGIAL